jgi:hypothetical protein
MGSLGPPEEPWALHDMRNAYKVLIRKPDETRLGRHRGRWENIKTDLTETRRDGVD